LFWIIYKGKDPPIYAFNRQFAETSRGGRPITSLSERITWKHLGHLRAQHLLQMLVMIAGNIKTSQVLIERAFYLSRSSC
jgi:hypothetical protein